MFGFKITVGSGWVEYSVPSTPYTLHPTPYTPLTTINHMKVLIIFFTAIASVVAAETGLLVGARVLNPPLLGLGEKVHAETRFLSSSENQPRVDLRLMIDRQISVESQTGETEFKWQPLASEDRVLPGDILRYRLVGKNNGSQPVSSMVLTQPIPSEMTYILNSAKGASNITFSIDNGVTFNANPTIANVNENGQVVQQAAPPENYTHVRWNFERVLDPEEEFVGTFEVRVR
jgi:uncharacterized repeat protein (TIGR01451 family)